MALKPGTIKALFGKLATNADDIARYGDDVMDVARPYADDVAEDTARLLDYYNSQSKWNRNPYFGKYVESPILQNALQGSTGYYGGVPVDRFPSGGVLAKAYDYADYSPSLAKKMDDAMLAAPELNTSNNTIDFLGDFSYSDDYYGDAPTMLRGWDTVDVPALDKSGLVKEFEYGDSLIRPHENTALGRWFRKQMSKKV
jgi:hypothetical protein